MNARGWSSKTIKAGAIDLPPGVLPVQGTGHRSHLIGENSSRLALFQILPPEASIGSYRFLTARGGR